MAAATIAEQVHKLIDPKLSQLEQSIAATEKEAERILKEMSALKAEQEIALRVLQVIPNGNGNGHTNGNGAVAETPTVMLHGERKPVKLYGKPAEWIAKQKPGRKFTAKMLVAFGVAGTPDSARQACWSMKKLGLIEESGVKRNGTVTWVVR